MVKQTINIPNGWTYFIHGTNSAKWKDNLNILDSFTTDSELSCITEDEAREEMKNRNQYNKRLF